MKTVLIIGADFSPSSLPPATRIRFFAKHLSKFGWHPVVLTTGPEYYEWDVDDENGKLIPNSVEVIRTKAIPARLTRKVGLGDIGLRTVWHHWQTIKRICRERQIDLIFIPVPPSVPMVLGRMAHRKFGIPYVIDYIDPWVTDAYKNVPRKQRPPKWLFADTLSRVLEPFALRDVAHITGVSKGTTDQVRHRYGWLTEGDATEIPYGAESDDFAYVRTNPRNNQVFDPADGLVHVGYIGACVVGMHPTIRAMFKSLRKGLDEGRNGFERLRLHFVGTSYAVNGAASRNVLQLAEECGVSEYVDERPHRVSYLDSLQLMLDCSALMLIGSDQAHYTASKIFPYLMAGKPLVAVFHEDSNVISILAEAGAPAPVTYDSSDGPESRIQEIVERLNQIVGGNDASEASVEVLAKYSTASMTAHLANCFARATAR